MSFTAWLKRHTLVIVWPEEKALPTDIIGDGAPLGLKGCRYNVGDYNELHDKMRRYLNRNTAFKDMTSIHVNSFGLSYIGNLRFAHLILL